MKDRMKASKKHQQIVSATGGPVIASAVRKSCACGSESTKTVAIEVSRGSKSASEHVSTVKQTIKASNQKKKERSQPPRKRKKGAGIVHFNNVFYQIKLVMIAYMHIRCLSVPCLDCLMMWEHYFM